MMVGIKKKASLDQEDQSKYDVNLKHTWIVVQIYLDNFSVFKTDNTIINKTSKIIILFQS